MRAKPRLLAPLLAVAAVACAAPGRPTLAELLAEATEPAPIHLWLVDDELAGAAVPIGPGSLPRSVRTTFEAIAPGGTTTFLGRERSPRGDGFRLEKSYVDGATTSTRSVFVANDGSVLERWHSVPIAEVSQDLLAVALRNGPTILEARTVWGPDREEHWTFVVADRSGRTFVADIGLDGTPLRRWRRLSARLDA